MNEIAPSLQAWLLDVPRTLPVCVRKRDGAIARFDALKIIKSFQRVGMESGEFEGQPAAEPFLSNKKSNSKSMNVNVAKSGPV